MFIDTVDEPDLTHKQATTGKLSWSSEKTHSLENPFSFFASYLKFHSQNFRLDCLLILQLSITSPSSATEG